MWEGNFIKYRLVRTKKLPGSTTGEKGPCHAGCVTFVQLIRDPQTNKGVAFVTGGSDGKLCWWDFKTVDEAEIDMDKTTDFEVCEPRTARAL